MPPGVTIDGGPGDSPANAYVVRGARTSAAALQAEYAYLASLFGRQGLAWVRVDARTLNHGDRVLDEIVLELLPRGKGMVWSAFFDVTETIASTETQLAVGQDPNEEVRVHRGRFEGPDGEIVLFAILSSARGYGYVFTITGERAAEIGLPGRVLEQIPPTLPTREDALRALEEKVKMYVSLPWTNFPWTEAFGKDSPS